jgi:hypothetical protein
MFLIEACPKYKIAIKPAASRVAIIVSGEIVS